MYSVTLSQELLRLIFSSVCALPEPVRPDHSVGLTAKELLRKERVTIEIDGKRKQQAIWFGEVNDDTGACTGVLTTTGAEEFALVLNHGETTIGLRFDWSDVEPGLFLQWVEDGWLPLSLSQKLMIAVVMNDLMDDGRIWEVPVNTAKTWPELHERLLSLIEHEDTPVSEKVDSEEESE